MAIKHRVVDSSPKQNSQKNKKQNVFSPQRHSFPPMVCLVHQLKCTLSEGTKWCYNGEQVNNTKTYQLFCFLTKVLG